MKLFTLFILLLCLATCSAETVPPASNCKVFCNVCQEVFGLIQKNVALVESISRDQLTGLIDHVCKIAPNIEILKLVCEIAKNDVVDGINKFLDYLKQNVDPATTCHSLSAC